MTKLNCSLQIKLVFRGIHQISHSSETLMPSENKIKLALLLALSLSLMSYHAMEAFVPISLPTNAMALLKIAQLVSTAILFLAFLYWPPLVRFLLGQAYIGGIWRGDSEVETSPEVFEVSAKEEFEINQSVFQTVLTGRSYDTHGKVKSIWTARLYRVEGLRYWFAMELNTSDAEVGVLQFSKHESRLDGLYHPGNSRDSRVFRFTASRI